ncbi:DNA polymerase III subunit gamma and tau [Kribbella soli]|uniref:DNA-directed DNA polymerase n=1 Tax=Kribbella soli TaxID=1124743 RepID=A0A4R0HS02_9ACTN|nr:DNA polymerase III subunit gamma and tau [Kribbella soli]TCC12162.1 DNA polymerase III subunit gamma and tau [Kribbella soli]
MEAPLALYRRYRPDTFAQVIGQDHVTAPLRNALSNNRVNHAYLFSGPRGCGKTTSARILARAINCEKGPIAEPCGVCKSCTDLARGGPGSIDVIEIDAASHGGVDDARDLRERAFFAPVESRYKIYIIDEAHMVTTQGFNALLKLVEEPPPHLKFIFATTEPDKVIGTIRSRTHHYPFRLVPPKVLADYMATLCESEGVSIEPAVLPLVVRAGAGSVRDSLSVLDQLIGGAGPAGVTYELAVALLGFTPDSLLDACVDGFAAHDSATVFETIEKVIETGQDPKRFAEDLLRRLRDLVVLSAVPTAVTSGLIEAAEDQAERLQTQAAGIGPAELTRAADIVAEGLLDMRGATAPRLQLELICAKVLLPGADDSTNGIQARLDRMERRLAIGVPGGTPDGVSAGGGTPDSAQAAAGTPGAVATSRAAARAAATAGNRPGPTDPPSPDGATAPGSTAGESSVAGASGEVAGAGQAGGAGRAGSDQSAGGSGAGGAESAGGGPAGVSGGDASVGAASGAGGGGDGARRSGGGAGAAAQGSGGGARTGAWGDESAAQSSSPAQATSQPQSTSQREPSSQSQAGQGAAAGGVGAVGLGDVRRLWPQVLEAVKAQRRFAWIMLSQNAQVIAIDDQTLTLGLVNAGARESFARSGSDEILRQAMIDTIGVDRRVEAVVDPSTDPGAGGGSAGRPGPQSGGPGNSGGPGPQPGGAGGPGAAGPGGAGGSGAAGPGGPTADPGAGTSGPGPSGPGAGGPGASGSGAGGPGVGGPGAGGPAAGGPGAGAGSSPGGGVPGAPGGAAGGGADGSGVHAGGGGGAAQGAARGDGRGAVALQEPPASEYDVPPEDPWEDGQPAQQAPQSVVERREQAGSKRRAAEAAVAAEQARQAASAAAAAPEVPLTPEEEADSIGEDDVVLEEDSRSHTDLLRETLGAQIITEEPN